ncbi:MAG: thioredoxin TrxC [Sandaracinaceae bacterium]
MIVQCSSCGAKNRIPSARLADRPRCGQCKSAIALDAPVTAASAEELDEIVRESPVPVVVDFWAPWCQPCRIVAPELEKLARKKSGQVLVVKVNTQDLPDVGARHGISGIPTFVRFDGGRESKRVSGAMPADMIARQLGV